MSGYRTRIVQSGSGQVPLERRGKIVGFGLTCPSSSFQQHPKSDEAFVGMCDCECVVPNTQARCACGLCCGDTCFGEPSSLQPYTLTSEKLLVPLHNRQKNHLHNCSQGPPAQREGSRNCAKCPFGQLRKNATRAIVKWSVQMMDVVQLCKYFHIKLKVNGENLAAKKHCITPKTSKEMAGLP